MTAYYHLESGVALSEVINDADATAGRELGVPLKGNVRAFLWKAAYANAPSAVSFKFQGTIDFLTWFDLDSSTATAGETKTVIDKVVRGVRGYVNTITPHASGSDVTFTVLVD